MSSRTGWVLAACGLVLGLTVGLSAAGGGDARDRSEVWVDLLSGEPEAYGAVLDDLAATRVVYLGERHSVARHHQWQARIVEDLAKKGTPLALGLEQVEAQYQPAVDRYNRGELSFDQLAKEIDWVHRWSGYENYRPAVEAARRAGAPILALNARAETVRQVARSGGVGKLNREARAELPRKMQLDDPTYESLLRLELGVHMAATPERLRPMVEAQIVRDETMAERLAGFLLSGQGKGRTAVVITGAGHISYGLGMPDRVRRRIPGVKDRIVLFSESGDVVLTPEMQAESRETGITHEDLRSVGRPLGDYLSVAAPR